MIKFLTFILFFINFQLFAQTQVDVIESFIIDKEIENVLSKKVIPNNDFKKVLTEDYFKLTFEEDLYDKELEDYLIVKNEFDLNDIRLSNSKKHQFLINHKSKNHYKASYSNVLYSQKGNYAIFYEEVKCGGLCDSGSLILMELIDGEWCYKSTLYAWIA